MSSAPCSCGCTPAGGGEKLILACSGAADVGEISDRAARLLTHRGTAKMYCLAGVGGRVPAILERTRKAARIVAIDGCEQDCVRHCLEGAGITSASHFRVTDLGLAKGRSPANDQNIIIVAEKAASLLA
jgi:uncharacterized metal-binding protein